MRALIVPMLVLTMFAAGCTSDAPTTSPTPTNTQGNGTATDIVYFVAGGKATVVAPTGTATVETGTGGAPGNPQASETWIYKFGGNGTITAGDVTVYVRAKEPTVHWGVVSPTGQGACTWRFRVLSGNQLASTFPCLAATPGPLSGDLEVKFALTFADLEVKKGASLTFEFLSFTGSMESGPTLFVLTGDAGHASRIQLAGASEVVPPANQTLGR